MLIACATIVSARPGSRSIIASTNSSSGTVSTPSSPMLATSSSADSASRAEPAPCRSTWSTRGVADVEAGVGGDPAHVLAQRVGVEQVELQVLGAAADRVGHLLRVGRGEHEHDVRRRLLERLQQRRLGRLRQHVHLVEDVHLVAPGRAERGLLDEVAHRVDAVVARRVEFVHVVARAALDGEARLALAARLAVDRVLAVEHLGEDARRGGLAGAARAGEQVRLALAPLGHRRAQRLDHVVLTLDLAETSGPVAAVQRLGGHRGHDSEGCDSDGGCRCGMNVNTGERPSLRSRHGVVLEAMAAATTSCRDAVGVARTGRRWGPSCWGCVMTHRRLLGPTANPAPTAADLPRRARSDLRRHRGAARRAPRSSGRRSPSPTSPPRRRRS